MTNQSRRPTGMKLRYITQVLKYRWFSFELSKKSMWRTPSLSDSFISPRASHAAAIIGDHLWIYGGYMFSSLVNNRTLNYLYRCFINDQLNRMMMLPVEHFFIFFFVDMTSLIRHGRDLCLVAMKSQLGDIQWLHIRFILILYLVVCFKGFYFHQCCWLK